MSAKDKPVWKLDDNELMEEIGNIEAALKGIGDGSVILEGSDVSKESLEARLKDLQASLEHRVKVTQ